jgi:hypothetical protein
MAGDLLSRSPEYDPDYFINSFDFLNIILPQQAKRVKHVAEAGNHVPCMNPSEKLV